MSDPSIISAPMLATVTVTFNPDIALLETQLRAIPPAYTKIVVDNASRPNIVKQVAGLVRGIPNASLVRNDANVGLAAAVNKGVDVASCLAVPPKFVLLLDQDSEPRGDAIASLISAFLALEAREGRVGCVGPLLRDPGTGLTHGFHQCTRWQWRRVHPVPGAPPVPCANLNGSGTLVKLALFQHLHGLDERLFIDHVDTEWAFRILALGYSLWGIPDAVFEHRMGDASRRIWLFGWRLWPDRAPRRHYFLFRNTIILMRRDYVLRVWKVWAIAKLALTVVITMVLGPRRWKQLTSMARGIHHGCHGEFPH